MMNLLANMDLKNLRVRGALGYSGASLLRHYSEWNFLNRNWALAHSIIYTYFKPQLALAK